MNNLEAGEQFTIAELFRHLQKVHNTSAETASHLAFLARTLKPDQFSIILKHSICPLVQLEIPTCLCNPGELKFAKKDLSPEEAFEQCAVNTVLPCPYHPNLEKVEVKHPTRCLAVVVHYTLREKLLDKFHESQGKVTDIFQVECKKFFTSLTGRTYDTGKKLAKTKKKEKELKELEFKKERLKRQTSKAEKQDQAKVKETDKPATATTVADEDMPMLISNSEEEQERGVRKKIRMKKPMAPKPKCRKVFFRKK